MTTIARRSGAAAVWSPADIADAVASGLRSEAAVRDEEQSVRGLDALEELELQPLVGAALVAEGYGVHREQRYPADRRRRRESEGERCDFVLTPDGRPLVDTARQATLFAPSDAVELEDAFWLELKVVAQFQLEGPNGAYASQLLSTVHQDVRKLSKDRGILHAAILIVLFTEDARVARHDLGVWQDRCLDRGLPIAAPYIREFGIADRLGNTTCTLALYGVAHL